MIHWKIVIRVYIDRSITKVSIEWPETGRKPLKKHKYHSKACFKHVFIIARLKKKNFANCLFVLTDRMYSLQLEQLEHGH